VFDGPLRAWDGEEVVVGHDATSGAWMFVCVHSTVLGPAAGGTRMKVYPTPGDALGDGLRLSSAMTRKNAVAELPLGGGKGVLAVPDVPTGEARRSLLLRYADVLESLHGTYWTASDMNTTPADMDVIGERCTSVFGRTEAHGGSGTSAPATADGVLVGIRASAKQAFGTDDLSGRTVLVQGVGSVGAILARLLADGGARVIVTDVDEIRAKEVAVEVDADVVAPDEAIATECDVFSPNATGGVVSAESIPRLRCGIVAGAANNQLAQPEDAERLAERKILYAPDYVVNSGGIIHLASLEMLGETVEERDARISGIGDTVTEVFRIADAEGISTERAADRIVQRRLTAATA